MVWRMEHKEVQRACQTTAMERGAGWGRAHSTAEDREGARESKPAYTLVQGACPWVCPAGAMIKEGMKAARRMECKEAHRMVPTAAPATRDMEVRSQGTTHLDRAKREGTEGTMGEE